MNACRNDPCLMIPDSNNSRSQTTCSRVATPCRMCAEKMEIGVNYVPETPNLARVVEMKALTEALRRAFPELSPDQYPWPHRQKGGQQGYSWTNPPQLPTCASSAQQALDRIRRIAVPRLQPKSGSHAEAAYSHAQVIGKRMILWPLVPWSWKSYPLYFPKHKISAESLCTS